MRTFELLEDSLRLIEDENHWCQGAVRSGGARCAIGALNFAAVGFEQGGVGSHEEASASAEVRTVYGNALRALEKLAEREGFSSDWIFNGTRPAIANFNNARSHAEVVALFQGAIRNEKTKEGIPLDVEAPVEVEVCS